MALYETVFIVRQDLNAEGVDALTDKLSKVITDKKGKIISSEYWGLRNLAYKINKSPRGHYVLLNIDAEYDAVAELERIMGFNEDVVRILTFTVDSHKKESELFASKTAKEFKPGKEQEKPSSKTDEILAKVQFEV